MSAPIVEQIAAEMKATLEGITAAAGFALDVAEVIRPVRTGVALAPANYAIILLAGQEEAHEAVDLMGNPPARGWRQQFGLDLCLRVSESDRTPVDTLANLFAAEVETALMADRSRGGLAIDTIRRGRDFLPPGDDYEGVTLFFDVIYRVAENDPYTRI